MRHEVVITSPPSRLAFEAVVRRYAGYVWNVARGVLRDPARAEDASQDAFAALLAHEGAFEAEAGLRVWLGRVAHNAACKQLRARGRRRAREAQVASSSTREEPGMDATREQATEVAAWIEDLPDEQRLVMRLKYRQQMPQREIAEVLGCSTGTVSHRLRDARETLRGRASRASLAAAPALGLDAQLDAGLEGLVAESVPAGLVEQWVALPGLATAAGVGAGLGAGKIALAVATLLVGFGGLWVLWLAPTDDEVPPPLRTAGGPVEDTDAVDTPVLRGRGEAVVLGDSDAQPAAVPGAPARPGPAAAPADATTFALSGVVRTPVGAPAEGARVVVATLPKSGNPARHEVATDADGHWRVTDLSRKRLWRVFVEYEGAVTWHHGLGRVTSTPAPLETQLVASWSVEGVLRAPDGTPITRGVRVRIIDPSRKRRKLLSLDREGRFRLPELDPRKLPPGTTRVAFEHDAYRLLRLEDLGARIGRDGTARVDLRFEPGAEIAGLVRDPDGHPAKGVRLMLLPEGASPSGFSWDRRQIRSDAEGRYSFGGLEPGRYVLRARGAGGVLETPRLLVIEEVAHVPVDLALGRGRTIVGRVVDADGSPLTHVTVAHAGGLAGFGLGMGERVDDDGRFRLEALPMVRSRYYLSLANIPSRQGSSPETLVVRETPREVEILVRFPARPPAPTPTPTERTPADPRSQREDGPSSRVSPPPGPSSGAGSQGTAQTFMPSTTVQVDFPEGE